MTLTYAYPRRKRGVPCSHLEPRLKDPWWTYACCVCSPGCWKTFTEPDPRPEDERPERVECPLCLTDVKYRDGRMRRHFEDRFEDCRCSGMSEQLAERYVDALLGGQSVLRFVHDSLDRRGITIEAREPEKVPQTILQKLIAARRDRDWTQGYVAALLAASRTTVVEWESGKNDPLIGSAIRWADVLGMQLHVVGDDMDQPVDSQAIIAWWLSELRTVSLNKLAAKIGVDSRSLSRWESGRATFRLADLQDWTEAFGFTVELRGKVEA